MLPPVLKVMPECHRRCVWSGHATSCLQCRCRRSRQNVIGGEDGRGGTLLPPMSKVMPECHRRRVWLMKR